MPCIFNNTYCDTCFDDTTRVLKHWPLFRLSAAPDGRLKAYIQRHSHAFGQYSHALLHAQSLRVSVHVDDELPLSLAVLGALGPGVLHLGGTQVAAVLREVPVRVGFDPATLRLRPAASGQRRVLVGALELFEQQMTEHTYTGYVSRWRSTLNS